MTLPHGPQKQRHLQVQHKTFLAGREQNRKLAARTLRSRAKSLISETQKASQKNDSASARRCLHGAQVYDRAVQIGLRERQMVNRATWVKLLVPQPGGYCR